MRKIFCLLLMLPLLALLGSCDKQEEIVFDHELPQFELKENAILLEVIMPQGTVADDELYIVGDFNGGDEAVGKLEWRLEKAPNSDVKWGIYIIPSTFANGKTLADGFYFVSKKKGVERSVKNEDVVHTLNVGVGTRTNVTVSRWKAYFEDPEEPGEHDGFVVYVEDNSGWDELALYGWGDGGNTVDWPGIQVTGTKTIGKVTYKYFDMGEEMKDKVLNLIFNNNNHGKQFDGPNVTINRDFYFRITENSCEEVVPSTYTGYTIYVADNSGWDELAIYGYANGGDVTPGWPGATVTGTKVIKGVTYKYFDMGEALNDAKMNLIFNNNNHGKQFDGPEITLNRDFYFGITATACKEVDPNAPAVDPDVPAVETYAIYVEDNSGWAALAVYGYADGGAVTPGWPGLSMTGTKEIGGKTFKYFEFDKSLIGKTVNLIFNNTSGGEGNQFNGPEAILTGNLYFSITASACTALEAPVTAK